MIPANLQRRIEVLEAQVQTQATLINALRSRPPQTTATRWMFLARTIKVGGEYPPSGNTFGFQFLDRGFQPIEGLRTATDTPRSEKSQAIGRTIDGSYLPNQSVVMAIPMPPPPGESDKGRWLLLPTFSKIFCVTNEAIAHASTGKVERIKRVGGEWVRSGEEEFDAYDIFLNTGETIPECHIVGVVGYEGVAVVDSAYCHMNDWLQGCAPSSS